eukprot:Sspe_Gene.113227::Locus_97191_Transcript_2_3_Confidence_0.333_Length_639::g.113227::m.113227
MLCRYAAQRRWQGKAARTVLAPNIERAPPWALELQRVVARGRLAEGGGAKLVSSGFWVGGRLVLGVNHGLHLLLSPSSLHRAMLHGCAEHNALAALLAQGLRVEDVEHVALYSEVSGDHLFPCLSCSRLLRSVAEAKGNSLSLHLLTSSSHLPHGHIQPSPPPPGAVSRFRNDPIDVSAWVLGM